MGQGREAKYQPGTKIGKLTVVQRHGSIGLYAAFICRCDCLRMRRVAPAMVVERAKRTGYLPSCGCGNRPRGRPARVFKCNGVVDTVRGWAGRHGITPRGIRRRLKLYPVDIALALSQTNKAIG